jgi:hypothetical protein
MNVPKYGKAMDWATLVIYMVKALPFPGGNVRGKNTEKLKPNEALLPPSEKFLKNSVEGELV